MAHLIPMRGTEAERSAAQAQGDVILDGEINSTTDDQTRLFLRYTPVSGSVFLGEVATEAAMLALGATHQRGCWPQDLCIRTDTLSPSGAVTKTWWRCIANHGALLAEWQFAGYAEPITFTSVKDEAFFLSMLGN